MSSDISRLLEQKNYRHHRHPSNASESSVSTHLSLNNSVGLVEEPLPMEGHFATMDLHSSPSQYSSFLPNSSEPNNSEQQQQHPFRYDTLTWAKEHQFPEPQDTILATAGIYPKSSLSNLSSLLEPLDHHHQQQQHQHNQFSDQSFQNHFNLPQQQTQGFSDHQSDRPVSRSNSITSNSSFLNLPRHSSLNNNNNNNNTQNNTQNYSTTSPPQAPTITTESIHSNPTSPLLRLNMNHPAMPPRPSISLTSATPLTAKPPERMENFFKSTGATSNHLSSEPTHHNSTDHHMLSQFSNSANYDIFQSFVNATSPSLNTNHNPPQNSFLSARPVRSRQRSKSESQSKLHFNPIINNSLIPKSFLSNQPTNSPPPLTDFFPISPPSNLDPQHPSPSASSTSSKFWTNLETSPQATLASQFLQSSPNTSCSLEEQGQTIPQLTDSSFLQGLLDEFNPKKPSAGDAPGTDYQSSSLLKPVTQLHHRRSHSVSHPAVHRRGRSEGLIIGGPMRSPFDLSMPQQLSSDAYTQPFPVGLSPKPTYHTTTIGTQPGLLIPDPSWPTSFSVHHPSSHAYPVSFAAPSPATSEACPSQYSSRTRSYSHSSYESEDTAGSTPHAKFLPLEFRSKTTAATKAAAIRRRKVGVAARYICDMCGESFTRRYNLRGHQRAHKGEKPFECGYPGCNSRFARAHDQKRHYKLHLGVKDYSCPVCRKTFIRHDALQRHHKSDAGQACFLELQQRQQQAGSISTSSAAGVALTPTETSDTYSQH
ncbi:uncharacterized protein VP01_253g11 [Puccinia sorghi]|uniref:C2H2-type domain-containing protein n=1 Tax=Puccinia sorghi TaxID=27349 RepID=A0A0L6V577_9BASI|nr:uncharacterized protein VP01_253g11 [Puccinia sorghi]